VAAHAIVNARVLRPLVGVDRLESVDAHFRYQSNKGNTMIKLLSALIAAVFAVVSLTPVAFAQEKKGEEKAMEKKDGKADKKKSEGKKSDEKKKDETK
jgi:hypothetical protein